MSTQKDRKKANIKRLVITFICTFVVFFIVLNQFVPALLPELDIPALNNNDDDMTGNDFKAGFDDEKGNIDPRLKSLEDQETAPRPTMVEKPIEEETQINNTTQSAPPVPVYKKPKTVEYDTYSNDGYDNDYSSTENDTTSYNNSSQQNSYKPKMTKVLIGAYKSPADAQVAVDKVLDVNPNLSPFVKEKNGLYYLQVASYSESYKAEYLANDFLRKGFVVKLINE